MIVEDGGCSGFQYAFKLIETAEVNPEEDYLFKAGEQQVVADSITMDFINGSTVDYKEEMIRSSFEISHNPNAELGCSCGTSFAPKN